ncbi:MAG: universal stress protein [Bacteroidia bacterium]|nr:universal stress protein [Bacteroidia bacterium]
MKTLLIPTDFSAPAMHALKYAVPFAQKLEAKIVLFHAHPLADYYAEAPAYMIIEKTETIKQLALRRLEGVRKTILEENPGLTVEIVIQQGPFQRELHMYLEEYPVDWIIMGTKGAQGIRKIFAGTQTAKVIGHTSCPVLAIPEKSNFKGISDILYATNFEDETEYVLRQVAAIASRFHAKVHILHIASSEDEATHQIFDWYQDVIGQFIPAKSTSFHRMVHTDIEAGIQSFVDTLKPDMLIMSTRRRNWKENLIEGSHTRNMAFQTHVPLLALHAETFEYEIEKTEI